jgi:hypothetical protein
VRGLNGHVRVPWLACEARNILRPSRRLRREDHCNDVLTRRVALVRDAGANGSREERTCAFGERDPVCAFPGHRLPSSKLAGPAPHCYEISMVIRRWNEKPFTEDRVAEIDDVVGVYLLMTRSGYVNYVAATRQLGSRLHRHLVEGDIPAATFAAYQTRSYEDAKRLCDRLIGEHMPYYNEAV